jgi:hypothetical protein
MTAEEAKAIRDKAFADRDRAIAAAKRVERLANISIVISLISMAISFTVIFRRLF